MPDNATWSWSDIPSAEAYWKSRESGDVDDNVIRLREAGLPFVQIAAELGITKGRVAGIVYRARLSGKTKW